MKVFKDGKAILIALGKHTYVVKYEQYASFYYKYKQIEINNLVEDLFLSITINEQNESYRLLGEIVIIEDFQQ